MTETYKMKFKCINCENTFTDNIKKGVPLREHKAKCLYCGVVDSHHDPLKEEAKQDFLNKEFSLEAMNQVAYKLKRITGDYVFVEANSFFGIKNKEKLVQCFNISCNNKYKTTVSNRTLYTWQEVLGEVEKIEKMFF